MPILTNILQKNRKNPNQNENKKTHLEKQKSFVRTQKQKQNEPVPAKEPKKTTQKSKNKELNESLHNAYKVVVSPHLSEKSFQQKDKGKYIFDIFHNVTANDVRTAIKKLYGVEIVNVQIMKVANKNKRMRTKNIKGKSVRFNKAVVTLKKGDSIDILPQ